MSEEKNKLDTAEEQVHESTPFEPSPRWKRIGAWILVVIVTIGVINWLISIAYPDWPAYILGLFR